MSVEYIEGVQIFIEKGGEVLYAILALTFLMWFFLMERFIYLGFYTQKSKAMLLSDSQNTTLDNWKARKYRDSLINQYTLELKENVSLIKTLIVMAPFLGLLGTVTGMIEIFDVMAATGSNDAKSMASGVSRATIPTLSGMVISIVGIFAINFYESRVKKEIIHFKEGL
jgi:biopolymer transport protein ExbB